MRFRLTLLFAFCSVASDGHSQSESVGIEIDGTEIIDQRLYRESKYGCGPAAVANSLRFGKPEKQAIWQGIFGTDRETKLRYVIDRYFLGRQSVVYPELKRLQPRGVEGEDLTAAYAEILKDHNQPAVKGRYLERQESEGDLEFVARLHGELRASLKSGIPPILGIRSFLAQRDENKDAETNGKIAWKPARHHYVVVTRVPDNLREGERGFAFELIDPNGGKVQNAFVYDEPLQPFTALKGNEKTGQWLTGSPFLVVQAPGVVSLLPRDATWRDRIVLIAHYLISPVSSLD